ncbi:hypothetical protein AAF463_23970 (plasmid) [Pantoea sp. BJ2]|uniref:ADF-H domain-containing protein n=1 Tax=Pantoea sp. BJ2 TaxID=3141322 RepID=A0AAU7U4J3_9GAMM
MPDIHSAEIQSAYNEVRDVSNDVTVCSINLLRGNEYTDPLFFRGDNAFREFRASIKDDEITYAYAKIILNSEPEISRNVFVLIIWIGKSVSVLRKAKVSIQAGDVRAVFNNYHLVLTPNSLEEITTEAIQKFTLKK